MSVKASSDPSRFGVVVLIALVIALGLWAGGMHPGEKDLGPARLVGSIVLNEQPQGTLRVEAAALRQLWWSDGPDGAFVPAEPSILEIPLVPDSRRSERMLATPTAVQWNHPLSGLPSASVVRVVETDDRGQWGPVRMYTKVFQEHGDLAVVSLALSEGALFDPDTGIYVVGNAMLAPPARQLSIYQEDGRWWKYPGNYSMRGKEWERAGMVQVLSPNGSEEFQCQVGVRVHGNMTRGFPLKALRLSFKEGPTVPLYPDVDIAGSKAMLLRPGGNDGTKAMMRDAVANEVCAGLPFEVSRARPAVLYLNGAYWGLHHIRQRLDEKELSLRQGVRAKDIRMLEVELGTIHGDTTEVRRFRSLVQHANEGDAQAPGFVEAMDRELDIDGFVSYMAACMILGQHDWPLRNVRLWRQVGMDRPGAADGRWRFLLNDMDLALGATSTADGDLFHQLDRKGFALPDLWRGLMRNDALKARFGAEVERLLLQELSSERMLERIDHFAHAMAPEMERHVARWRKPASVEAWEDEVEVMRTFARERPAAVRRQMVAKEWPR